MKQKFSEFLEKYKQLFRNVLVVSFIIISLITGFYTGSAYNDEYGPKKPTINMVKVNRDQVNLALDEHNHLIIIDKKTGDYTVYQDSIGLSVFKLYARNIFSDTTK